MAMAVPRCVLCCSLRGGIARTAGWSDGFRQVASFSSSVVISNGLQPSLEGLGPTSEPVDGRVQHDSPWTLLRAPTQSGGPQATTSLSTVGCKPGHDTARTNSVPASTGKTSTETSVRRSVTFNPQGWETVFLAGISARYPGHRPWTWASLIGRTAVRSGIDVLLGTQSGHFASLRLSFCPGFLLGRAELSGLRFGHFYIFRGPGAVASGHTG